MADLSTQMKELLAAPLGELIASVGEGVADAQKALDAASLAQTLAIYSEENGDELLTRLREIGYQPTFYVLPETEVEAKVSVALSAQSTSQTNTSSGQANTSIGTGRTRARMYATPVNASNTNKFNLNASAAATIKFKIVPVPPSENVNDVRVVPTLAGKKLSEVTSILQQLNLQYQITNEAASPPVDYTDTTITAQVPEAGALIKAGNAIQITF